VPDQYEEGEQQQELSLRPFWSGTLTFGLVSIPVNLYPAQQSGGVSLRMIDQDGTPLSRRYFCSKEDREITYDEIVRGYEIGKDEFVPVTDEELEALEPNKTRDIDLTRFVGRAEIDPMFFERAYYLAPGGTSNKAYRLLAATLEQSGRAGIATFVMREKEYIVAILADNGILRAETLRFLEEIRTAEDLGLPAPMKPSPATVKKFEEAIERNAKDKLSLKELEDAHAARMLALVHRKEKRNEDVFELPEEQEAEESAGVLDLMQLLKRSMSGKEEAEGKTGRKQTAASTKKRSRTKKSA
jgi:DNA end-binding protein Ku